VARSQATGLPSMFTSFSIAVWADSERARGPND
jgi:hypothetical protein